jgi:hypothetical protein
MQKVNLGDLDQDLPVAKPTRTIEQMKEAIAKLDEFGVVCSDGTPAKEFLARIAEQEKLSQCPRCVHNNLNGTCKAFPEGIVWVFKQGRPHDQPIPMQKNTLVFEPTSPEQLEQRQNQSETNLSGG